MPNLTDMSTIRDLCARHNFELSKGFGQNFIINPGICPRIAEAAGITAGWGALEVGPGIGVLTEQLCKRADKVVSVEVDKRLPPILDETMAAYDNFKLVLEDVLKVDLRALLTEEFGDKPVAVCANLPYYITSPILMRLLEEKLPIRNITVMVQKEAAQRLCAAPGTREAGAISYAVAYYAEPKLLFSVQPGSVSEDGQTAVMTAELTCLSQGDVLNIHAYPMHLLRENGLWKISYAVLTRMMEAN